MGDNAVNPPNASRAGGARRGDTQNICRVTQRCLEAMEGLNPTQCARVIRMLVADRCSFMEVSPRSQTYAAVAATPASVTPKGVMGSSSAKALAPQPKPAKRPVPTLDKKSGKKAPADFHWKDQAPKVYELQQKTQKLRRKLLKKFKVSKINDLTAVQQQDSEVIEFRSLSEKLFSEKSTVRAQLASKTGESSRKKRAELSKACGSDSEPMQVGSATSLQTTAKPSLEGLITLARSAGDTDYCKPIGFSGWSFCGYDRNFAFSTKTGKIGIVFYPKGTGDRIFQDAGVTTGNLFVRSAEQIGEISAEKRVLLGVTKCEPLGKQFDPYDTVNWDLPKALQAKA